MGDRRGVDLKGNGGDFLVALKFFSDGQNVPALGDHIPAAGVVELVG